MILKKCYKFKQRVISHLVVEYTKEGKTHMYKGGDAIPTGMQEEDGED